MRSVGEFPQGIRAEMLSGEHPSIRRNPLIAGAFHRTGAVEVWGRGTNRAIEACNAHGIAPPEFKQEGGVVTVTFRVPLALGSIEAPSQPQAGTMPAPWEGDSTPGSTTDQLRGATGSASSQPLFGTMSAPSWHQVRILELALVPRTLEELMTDVGRTDRTKLQRHLLAPLLAAGLIERTIPDKPRNSKQKYRTTEAGRRAIEHLK